MLEELEEEAQETVHSAARQGRKRTRGGKRASDMQDAEKKYGGI